MCVRVDTPRALRVALLEDEYSTSSPNPRRWPDKLEPLVPVHGRKVIERWVAAAAAGDFATLIDELLVTHYDPTYGRSIVRNFPRHADAIAVTPHDIAMPAFRALARDLDARVNASLAVPA